jgi:hypothetical protein
MEWTRDDADPADGGGWVRAYFLRCHMCELVERELIERAVHESGRHMTLSWVEAWRG